MGDSSTNSTKSTGGRPSAFKGKPHLIGPFRVTDLGYEVYQAATARTGKSGSDVVEMLLRTHGGSLKAEDFGAEGGQDEDGRTDSGDD